MCTHLMYTDVYVVCIDDLCVLTYMYTDVYLGVYIDDLCVLT